MKMVKSLVLGSAAGLVAMTGAQAADLPVKAKAVEYVRVCSLYGAGFFYIPGTDTCIKLGGYLRVDTTFNGAGVQDQPSWNGDAGQGSGPITGGIGKYAGITGKWAWQCKHVEASQSLIACTAQAIRGGTPH